MGRGCYWGCGTSSNRVTWIVYSLTMVAGVIVWAVGLGLYMDCYSKHVKPCIRGNDNKVVTRDPETGKVILDCFDYVDSNNCPIYTYGYVWSRGVIVMCVAQILLCYFCCCANHPEDEAYSVSVAPAPGAGGAPPYAAPYGQVMMTSQGQPYVGAPVQGVPVYQNGMPVYNPPPNYNISTYQYTYPAGPAGGGGQPPPPGSAVPTVAVAAGNAIDGGPYPGAPQQQQQQFGTGQTPPPLPPYTAASSQPPPTALPPHQMQQLPPTPGTGALPLPPPAPPRSGSPPALGR